MSEPTRQLDPPDPWDECECGHDREDHMADGCQAIASSGFRCACQRFKSTR
jgi:hypothetical protein